MKVLIKNENLENAITHLCSNCKSKCEQGISISQNGYFFYCKDTDQKIKYLPKQINILKGE